MLPYLPRVPCPISTLRNDRRSVGRSLLSALANGSIQRLLPTNMTSEAFLSRTICTPSIEFGITSSREDVAPTMVWAYLPTAMAIAILSPFQRSKKIPRQGIWPASLRKPQTEHQRGIKYMGAKTQGQIQQGSTSFQPAPISDVI